MLSKKYCRYCLEVDQATVVRTWENGSHIVEIWGCSGCHERHDKEVTALQAELMSVQAAFAKRKAQLRCLRAAFIKRKETHETELFSATAKRSRALSDKKTEYEQLLSQVNELKAKTERQRRKLKFLELHCKFPPPLEVPTDELALYDLSAKSPVIEDLLCGTGLSATEVKTDFICGPVCDITGPVFQEILDFCHSGKFTFDKVSVPADEVLRAAHDLQIGYLKELCEAELCRRLSVDNVPQMLKLSRKFGTTKLQEEAGNLFKEHFDTLKSKVFHVLAGPDDLSQRPHSKLSKLYDSLLT